MNSDKMLMVKCSVGGEVGMSLQHLFGLMEQLKSKSYDYSHLTKLGSVSSFLCFSVQLFFYEITREKNASYIFCHLFVIKLQQRSFSGHFSAGNG